jgi:hypothetical protein
MADVRDEQVVISEAELQLLLQAMRRRQRPMTLDELVAVLREGR